MSTIQRTALLIALVVIMALTRSHHWTTFATLADASWAIFFIVGFYFRQLWIFAGLLVVAMVTDVLATSLGGVSDFCMSPAYVMLLPAYGALWWGGRWLAGHYSFTLNTVLWLIVSVTLSAFACELLSSGGFYVFSGRFEQIALAPFIARLWLYFPLNLQTMLFYVICATVVHVAIISASRLATQTKLPSAH